MSLSSVLGNANFCQIAATRGSIKLSNSLSILPLLVPLCEMQKGTSQKNRREQPFSAAHDDWQMVRDLET